MQEPNDELFTEDFRVAVSNYIEEPSTFNNDWFQQITSNACGDYCVYFVKMMINNDFNSLLSVFGENLKYNDKYVIKYVNKLQYYRMCFICTFL